VSRGTPGAGSPTRYCPRCARPLAAAPPTACADCGYHVYLNARPTGSVILVDGDRFLAIRRARAPHRGEWDLPGGFCDGWEHPADAAAREAHEEVGAAVTVGHLVGLYIGAYDFQGERFPVLDCVFLASVRDPAALQGNPGEVSEMEWFAVADPPHLGFDTMRKAITDARQLITR
jgi:8-oxo-dGTP diphosphatase